MSRLDKLQRRFLSVPKDFTWDELVKIITAFGYEEITAGKTAGSRRKFKDNRNNIISLHKPHPSTIVKEYIIRDLITHLKTKGQINDE